MLNVRQSLTGTKEKDVAPSSFNVRAQRRKNLLARSRIQLFQNILTKALAHQASVTTLHVQNFFHTSQGILVFFDVREQGSVVVRAQLFERAKTSHALWKHPKQIAVIGPTEQQWRFQRVFQENGQFISIWHSPDLGTKQVIYPHYQIANEVALLHPPQKLHKPAHNPLLTPDDTNSWEAFCTFNPAAVYAADKVHILYRAQGHDYVSKIGYATSSDGVTIDERLDFPIYSPTQPFEGATMPLGNPGAPFVSGGGCGGCEDPRATIIDDRVYLTYVAYDGWNPPRIALSSIALTDFLNRDFFWEKPVLISRPGVVDKSAVIFPEKINGKYVIMHRVFPNILIDFVDDLNFTGRQYLKGEYKIGPRSQEWWDSRKVGAGAPPLKTKEGWLLIYQAVDDKDASQYKVGAMLLDLHDPTKVLYRSSAPILEPREAYENHGFKAGVVYPCGAVILNNTLFVYYGGADSYVCVATANLDEFLTNLKKTGNPNISKTQLAIDSAVFTLHNPQ